MARDAENCREASQHSLPRLLFSFIRIAYLVFSFTSQISIQTGPSIQIFPLIPSTRSTVSSGVILSRFPFGVRTLLALGKKNVGLWVLLEKQFDFAGAGAG
jgi:hypothetical protein